MIGWRPWTNGLACGGPRRGPAFPLALDEGALGCGIWLGVVAMRRQGRNGCRLPLDIDHNIRSNLAP
jgi:hypothetical protein